MTYFLVILLIALIFCLYYFSKDVSEPIEEHEKIW